MITLNQQSVTVQRKDLITAIKSNRKEHISEYNQAYSDYKAKVKYELERALKEANEGKFDNVAVLIQSPVSHENDYNDIIEMLEMSVDDNITLDRDSFKAYIKNEWNWTRQFKVLNASYKIS